ncbi:MAG: ATP-binding protein [Acutalibacteraceae bacterium]
MTTALFLRAGRRRALGLAGRGAAYEGLSLNILDIAMNSVKAEATRIDIEIRETEDELEFSVTDNGFGMSEEMIRNVTDRSAPRGRRARSGWASPSCVWPPNRRAASQSRRASEIPNDCGTRTSAKFYKST